MSVHRVRTVSRGREGGFALVFLALVLTVLMAFAGFGVDVGTWYYVAQHEQKAADAAALAGVIYLPQTVASGSASYDRAMALANANGYPSGVTVSAVPNIPTQLSVTVTQTVHNSFAGLVGFNSTTIHRTAIAEYEAPVNMGSPAAIFGNEPDNPSVDGPVWNDVGGFQPNTWANVMGPAEGKASGDARQAGSCNGSADQCLQQSSNAGDNLDYSPDGYFYRITVPPAEAAAAKTNGYELAIEVFDPAMAAVGDHCTNGSLNLAAGVDSKGKSKTSNAAVNPYTTITKSVADATTRYAAGDSSTAGTAPNTDDNGAWCTGDNFDSGTSPPYTTFAVHQDTDPYSPYTTPVVAHGGCAGQQFGYWKTPSSGSWKDLLDQPTTATYDPGLARVFRQWVPVCIFDPSTQPAGDYFLQVRTDVPAFTTSTTDIKNMTQHFTVAPGTNTVSGGSAGFTTLPTTGGSNRFAIRAGWVRSSADTYGLTFPDTTGAPIAINQINAGVPVPNTFVGGYPLLSASPADFQSSNLTSPLPGLSISATDFMGMYANVAPGAAAPNFYMARVLPGGSGQGLEIRLWDIGDGAGAGTTLTFTLVGNSVGCTAQLHDGAANHSANVVPIIATAGSSCSFDVFKGGSPNGGWFTIDIPIPANYACNINVATDCWVKMQYVPVGGALNDTTTWGAQLLGNPVRLIK